MKEITKSGGYCSDGCQWSFCDFLRVEKTEAFELQIPKGSLDVNEYFPRKVPIEIKHFCDLFNQEMSTNRGSLHICNQIYGKNYTGRV